MKKGESKYPELNDKEWLYQQYWTKGLSTIKIAEVVGCWEKTVWYALHRCGIKVRTQSEACTGQRNHCYGAKHSENWSKETKVRMSEVMTELYKNPEFHKKMFKSRAVKPTKPEKAFREIADTNSLPFRYTGDGKEAIGGKCPDFVHLSKKIVVEIFGQAYHSPLFAFFNVNYKRTHKGTTEHYKKHGYKCIIFWDRDLVGRKDAGGFVLSVLAKERAI